MKKIMFTGHRDCETDSTVLENLPKEGCIWIHGGARGFDTQVENFAKQNGIRTEVYLPDYPSHGRAAPIIRNREMLDKCDIVMACYDGRKSGGTFFVISEAKRMGKEVVLIPVHRI